MTIGGSATAGHNNTITLGNGDGDVVNDSGSGDTITLGNGSDTVTAGANSIIKVGNGADSVTAGPGSTITLGNGGDTVTAVSSLIHAGRGHDTFVFTDSFCGRTRSPTSAQRTTTSCWLRPCLRTSAPCRAI